ncbi:MAG TPA: hypothetical protein VFU22_13760, partial [Roseiflexaceae bacterium]|nr:hypothetical protein [Roseiflexaceae bacterium]
SVAIGLWLYLVPATMPPDRFNVAVAEFGVIDAQGRERVTADSRLIGRTLFSTIQGELEQLPPDYRALTWQDSMSFLQKRATIGAIAGLTPAERWPNACKRATELGADLIVYGVLDQREQPALLRLELCARSRNRERDFGNLDELQRVDRLGGPLPVTLPLDDVQASVNPPLRVRTSLVAKLVVGLRYELASNPDYQSSLRQALTTFSGALNYLESETGAATGENGGDIVQYFIGREHFLLYQDPATPASDRPARLEAALVAFARAVELNPGFARARNALGSVYFLQAQQVVIGQRHSAPQLQQALDAYSAAIPLAQAADDRSAEAEARLSLALTYRLRAEAALFQTPSDPAAAKADLARADQEAGAGEALIQPEQNRFQGFAAMVRGLIAHQQAQIRLRANDQAAARELFAQARDAYTRCIAAGQADPGDQYLKRQIIAFTCTPRQASVAAALQRIGQ